MAPVGWSGTSTATAGPLRPAAVRRRARSRSVLPSAHVQEGFTSAQNINSTIFVMVIAVPETVLLRGLVTG
ncbi:hypothetical protein GCM10010274_26510 [Streptomyces lavendofoliae]|uniref:Uncharacterized protein n=1 Tax=Streptomyces lavendofoliae TaxID=67314 RepID=A0A918HXI9_9ACTN|nr:hypothetical protein GCM10010274_26510 [Streptomyces lavendofoliae]